MQSSSKFASMAEGKILLLWSMNLLETSVQKVPLCRWVWLFNCAVLTGVCFIGGGMFFIETPPFSRAYIYLGGYVLEKLQRSGGGTFIWGVRLFGTG